MSIQPESPILFDIPEGWPTDGDFLERLGHEVLVCHGPPAKTLCPIVKGEGCSLVEAAHGVVFQLDLDRPQNRAILARYKEILRDDVPIWVVVDPEHVTRYADLFAGGKVLTPPPVAGELDALAADVDAAAST